MSKLMGSTGRASKLGAVTRRASSPRVLFQPESGEALRRGIRVMARAVGATLGPGGTSVAIGPMIGTGRQPEILRDGATIARRITQLPDPFVNIGAMLVRHAAWQVGERAGDGTTTATVMVDAIVAAADRYVLHGGNPMGVRRGLQLALGEAVDELAALARAADTAEVLRAVVLVASGDEQIARVIAEIYDIFGHEGVILWQESSAAGVDRRYFDGFSWDTGYLSTYFATGSDRQEAVLEEPHILMTDYVLEQPRQLLSAMETALKAGANSFAVVAPEVRSPAIALLAANNSTAFKGTLAIRAPGMGNRMLGILEDMATLTGGRAVLRDTGRTLDEIKPEDFGRAQELRAGRHSFTLVGGEGRRTDIQARVTRLQRELNYAKEDHEKESLKERIGKLGAGCATILVGGHTDLERADRMLRVQDAVRACRAAASGGVVAGGGTAYLALIPRLRRLNLDDPDEAVGVHALIRGLEEPCRRIASNCGYDGGLIAARVMSAPAGHGFDARIGDIVDMFAAGIVDPAEVVRMVIQAAVSAASMALTTEVLIHRPSRLKWDISLTP